MADIAPPSTQRKYVQIKEDKDVNQLEEKALEWVKVAHANRLTYEIDWLGVPIIQTPEDMVLMQELIVTIQPDIIIETGIAHGGSLIYYASLCELLQKGKVIGIDIDIRDHNKQVIQSHPLSKRIEMLQGSSTSEDIIEQVKRLLPDDATVMVCLDSDHTKDHVVKELQLYQHFVTPGSYLVVFDTNTSQLAEQGVCEDQFINNGPLEAIEEFLRTTTDFEIDTAYNKLYISYSPNGYLRRRA